MAIASSTKPFKVRLAESEADHFMQKAVAKAQDAQWDKRTASRNELGHWEQWRELGEQIRQHVVRYLPDYLEQFAKNAEARGAHVYFARTDDEAATYIRELAERKQVQHVVKSKSMVTTEIDLDKELLKIPGLSLLETDLAEFILEEDNWDEPTHIVFPTLHKNRDQVQAIFQKLGYDGDNDPQHLARFARGYLRASFLKADMGITGCNFGVADTGLVNLVTNEGNADLTMAIPPTQVVVMGMERLVPSLKEAEVLDNMLARSAVGQKLTSYCSFSSEQAAGESDGPTEYHIVIVDNGRMNALGGPFEQVLQCIRCGACLNVCPVYRHIGGHGYGSIYPGPIGAVLSPVLRGYQQFGDLPFASSLCGACTETCPVKIPLHQLLIKHREVMMNELHMDTAMNKVTYKALGMATGTPAIFHMGISMDHGMTALLSHHQEPSAKNFFMGDGIMTKLPFILGGWTSSRDMPRPPRHQDNFRSWFKAHKRLQEVAK